MWDMNWNTLSVVVLYWQGIFIIIRWLIFVVTFRGWCYGDFDSWIQFSVLCIVCVRIFLIQTIGLISLMSWILLLFFVSLNNKQLSIFVRFVFCSLYFFLSQIHTIFWEIFFQYRYHTSSCQSGIVVFSALDTSQLGIDWVKGFLFLFNQGIVVFVVPFIDMWRLLLLLLSLSVLLVWVSLLAVVTFVFGMMFIVSFFLFSLLILCFSKSICLRETISFFRSEYWSRNSLWSV